ncbi:CrcB protein [Serinicoccus hydrothermalis]|uniref:Fluoride-specific ion channel FluC n=1 Tax=Serinicoccus hydrothermalis TaxID=1758689 RepID=A0A1B1NBH5_9MICO|nr:CrcB family protein [Serinicoccus hydrothermalis]ANS78790.1 CrcB protein [Serinicoccus hydrothermalis]
MSSSQAPAPATRHVPTLLAVAVGGGLGAVLRWCLELLLPAGSGWPWATLVTNVLGSAALGWLVVHDDRHRHPHWLRPGVGTGLLGGFTTFSTYAVQTALLGRVDPLVGLVYLVVTAALCVAAAGLGARLARGGAS